MKITKVDLTCVSGPWERPDFPLGDRQVQALDIYPEFNVDRGRGSSDRLQAIYVEIGTDEGVSGLFGPIESTQAFMIATSLRPYLLGRDPLANELLLDQMWRLDRHGRSGAFATAISPVDCALWDLKGKAWGQPVYRLLGGPTRERVPVYASMLGFSADPQQAAATALEYRDQGYTAQKWFFRYGPGDGAAGKEKNLVQARALRQALGPHYTLMFDAFMGWDVPYAVEMVRALAPLEPRWMEEPIPPERVGGLRTVRQAASVPLATGEHVFNRWQVKELLEAGAVDVLQTDPDWVGGITEQVKICALGSAFEVPVIAHGHSLLPPLHLAAAQSPTTVPLVEFLIRYQGTKQYFHKPLYWPRDGALELPDLPGLGLVLDEDKIDTREPLSF